ATAGDYLLDDMLGTIAALIVGKCYGGSGVGQCKADGFADATASACNQCHLAIESHYLRAFRCKTRRAAAAIAGPFRPYFSASSSGSPDSPNWSRTPTNSIGQGCVCASASATALPRPP